MTALIALASGQLQVLYYGMTAVIALASKSATGTRLLVDHGHNPHLSSATGIRLRDDRGHIPRLW